MNDAFKNLSDPRGYKPVIRSGKDGDRVMAEYFRSAAFIAIFAFDIAMFGVGVALYFVA